MVAPVASARVSPTGIRLKDGYQTLITFARNTSIGFWERTVEPPGIDGGEEIDTTTMHNTEWRTRSERQLKTLTEFSITAMYDPLLFSSILSLINEHDTVTVTFPDGSTLAFFGYLKTFEPEPLEEGATPECTITIVPVNQDSDGNEEDPVLVNVAGT